MSSLGGILDVAIGMSFMYLLLSLFGSSLNELVAWVIGLRAKTLRAGLTTLLNDRSLIGLTDRLYAHPLVKSLSHKTDKNGQAVPSYIPASTFALALLDTLGQNGIEPAKLKALAEKAVAAVPDPNLQAELAQDCNAVFAAAYRPMETVIVGLRRLTEKLPDGTDKTTLGELLHNSQLLGSIEGIKRLLASLPEASSLRQQLELFMDDGVADIAGFRRRVEAWFDNAMDRLTGVYRRQAQFISLVVGLILAFSTGVDSVLVADALMSDGALRQATVTAAAQAVKSPMASAEAASDPGEATKIILKTMNQMDRLKLPVGWNYLLNVRNAQNAEHAKPKKENAPQDYDQLYWLWRILGMLFTGLALAFGAPFWFDMLSKLVNVRSAGPPPYREPATTQSPAPSVS